MVSLWSFKISIRRLLARRISTDISLFPSYPMTRTTDISLVNQVLSLCIGRPRGGAEIDIWGE